MLKPGADLDGFRRAVRTLVADDVAPSRVVWDCATMPGLFESGSMSDAPPITMSKAVASLVKTVVCHRDPQRFAELYQLIWRTRYGEPRLLDVHSDSLVHALHIKNKAIRRDLHKMHAFVRFRRIVAGDDERFIAWFEPDHYILEATANFFVERFRSLAWSILTPIGSLHWDRSRLSFGPAARREDAPVSDAFEEGWSTYYQATFNPARLNTQVMRGHMAKKYWHNMPETASIPRLVQSAASRVREMIDREASMPQKRNPTKAIAAMNRQQPQSLDELNAIISAAEPFVPGGTRAVLGEGPIGASIAFVGEQPGDQEDLQGRPFVGPAGQLLDRAMLDAGIDRKTVYVTNAVKHFKYEQRGKRRIHQTPTAGEVKHYRWWLERELEFVHPEIIVTLGATAALAVAGKAIPIIKSRGPSDFGFITIHPSYVLRLPDEDAKARAYEDFVADLRQVRALAASRRENDGMSYDVNRTLAT